EQLLELATRDEVEGLGDAPWPPHFRKMDGEAPRVAPSRKRNTDGELRSGRKGGGKSGRKSGLEGGPKSGGKRGRVKMPLITVANSPDKNAALAGLERWKARHADAATRLALDDV